MLFDTFATINIGSKGKLEKIEIFTSALAIYEIDNAIWNQVSRRKKLTVERVWKVLVVVKEVLKILRDFV